MDLLVCRSYQYASSGPHFSIGNFRCLGNIHWSRFCHRCHKLVQSLVGKSSSSLWMWRRPNISWSVQWKYVCHNSLSSYDIRSDIICCLNHTHNWLVQHRNPHHIEQSLHNSLAKLVQHEHRMSSVSSRISICMHYHRMHKWDQNFLLHMNRMPSNSRKHQLSIAYMNRYVPVVPHV